MTERLIDTHVHIWDSTRRRYPWLTGVAALEGERLPAAVDRAIIAGHPRTTDMIFVEAGGLAEDGPDEVRWAASLDWPELRGTVANVDLRDRVRLEERLDAVCAAGRVVGVRHNLQSDAAATFPELVPGLRALAVRGLPFDACVRADQLPAVAALLADVPTLRCVVDHLGKPMLDAPVDGPAGAAWLTGLRRVAAHPTAHLKVSGLGGQAPDRAAFDAHVGGYLRAAVAIFGPERAMLGSDWPVSTTVGAAVSFGDWVDLVACELAPTPAAWHALTTDTATGFYGL